MWLYGKSIKSPHSQYTNDVSFSENGIHSKFVWYTVLRTGHFWLIGLICRYANQWGPNLMKSTKNMKNDNKNKNKNFNLKHVIINRYRNIITNCCFWFNFSFAIYI